MSLDIALITDKGSNSSERVEWVLNYKGLPYTWTNYAETPAVEYRKLNPFLRVPTLLIDGNPVTESMAMIEFLEELQPLPSVLPASLWERAKVREICEIVNSTIHPIQNSKVAAFFIPGISKSETRAYRARWIGENLYRLAPLLFRESHFAYGTAFSLADVFVAPIFRKGLELGLDALEFPAFTAHLRHCASLEHVRRACPFSLGDVPN